MTTIELSDAYTKFDMILDGVCHGEEYLIGKQSLPVAVVVPVHRGKAVREPGSARGLIKMSKDFDTLPVDFQGYM